MTIALIDLIRALTCLVDEAKLMLKQTRKHDLEAHERAAQARGSDTKEDIELISQSPQDTPDRL